MRIFLLLFTLFLLYGCKNESVKAPQYITDSKQYSTLGIDYHDIDDVTSKSSKSLLESKFVQNIDTPQILAISNMANESGENIDVESITRDLTRKVSGSEKFILTNAITGSGSSVDSMIVDSRNLRNDKNFNQQSTQGKGNLLAPQYSLSGKIRGDVKNVGENVRVDYLFLFILTDLTTGKVVWDKAEVISKVAPKSVAKDYGLDIYTKNSKIQSNKNAKQDSKNTQENIDYEKYVKRCNIGEIDVCYRLTELSFAFIYNDADLMQKDCKRNKFDACATLASMYLGLISLPNLNVNIDYKKGYSLADNACKNENALGCKILGDIYSKGIGIHANADNSFISYKKSCSYGNAEACYQAYKNKSYSNNRYLLERSCELNYAPSCHLYAYELNRKEEEKRIYKQNCDRLNYAPSCFKYAKLLDWGSTLKKEYYKKACNLGFKESC